MNPSLYTVALIALTLVLAVTFALGLYWLATKERPTRSKVPAPASGLLCDEHNEWKAQAPYPGHVLRAGPFTHRSFDLHAKRDVPTDEDVEPFELVDTPPPFSSPHHDPEPQSDFTPYVPVQSEPSIDVAIHCPRCLSARIDTLNRGRKAGSTIGSVAGATSGMAMALSGAEAGMMLGFMGGPIGSVFGGIAGAVIAGLVGSTAGCAAGSAIGEALDENVLDNHICLACHHTFSVKQS